METKNVEENFLVERAKWLDYLCSRRDLTHGVFRVAYFLASKMNPLDKSMWWGVGTIAEEMGVSIATIVKATDYLSDKGLLVITPRKTGRARVNQYGFRMPLDPYGELVRHERGKQKKSGGRKRRVSKTETLRVSKTETEYNKA